MNSEQGERYVEAIAQNMKKIELRLSTIRYENAQKISRSHDKTAAEALANEIEYVDIIVDGEKVRIKMPDLWTKTFKIALARFKDRYGDQAAETIKLRYSRGLQAVEVYTRQCISKRLYQDRRNKFLAMFLLYAVQFKIFVVD